MFGKRLSDYLHFQRWILILIVAAFLLRLGMSSAGMPIEQARWVSVTAILFAGILYNAVAVHTRGFGGYKQLFGLLLILSVFAETLVALAIVWGIATGTDNIYTAPEYSGGGDGKNWPHVFAHLIGGILLALFSWLVAAPILFVTRKITPNRHIPQKAS
jgi:hypothetical protein